MNNPRIFLLPGFGEDAFVFDCLRPHFTHYDLIDLSYRACLDRISFSELEVWKFCKALIIEYDIKPNDLLIGHSMGGYFSYVLREIIGCKIVMIASFNDPQKIRRILASKNLNLAMVAMGFLKKRYFQNFLLKAHRGKYFEKEIEQVVNNFNQFSNSQLTKMMKLSFGNKIESKLKNPSRIHAKNDTIVDPPDEAYKLCHKGHFCLILEDENIADIIKGEWAK